MRRRIAAALLAGLTLSLARGEAAEDPNEKVEGYAEWRAGPCLVVDAQKVCPSPALRFRGKGDARDWGSIPLGYEVKVKKGVRLEDGTLLAREVEAQPNGKAMFEEEVRVATDELESQIRKAGRFSEGEGPGARSVGELVEDGPKVARVRRIVDNLLPPYMVPEDARVYVIENPEWNAFAMGNYSIYVFSGLLEDMDDDEVAIVLGHELVHATHEHSRKQAKKSMWIQIAALGALSAASSIDDDTKRTLAQIATTLAASAWSNGYGRGMEDQADRVGLRYAYEAGYDITKGPRLWNRFARKYGDGSKVVNFFFSDHSQAAARAAKLEEEIAFNYPEGPKPDGPAPPSAPAPAPLPAVARAPAPRPAATKALAAPASAATSARIEIRPGMTTDEVRRVLGDPASALVFGERLRWTYPDLTVVFEKGRVTDVRF